MLTYYELRLKTYFSKYVCKCVSTKEEITSFAFYRGASVCHDLLFLLALSAAAHSSFMLYVPSLETAKRACPTGIEATDSTPPLPV